MTFEENFHRKVEGNFTESHFKHNPKTSKYSKLTFLPYSGSSSAPNFSNFRPLFFWTRLSGRVKWRPALKLFLSFWCKRQTIHQKCHFEVKQFARQSQNITRNPRHALTNQNKASVGPARLSGAPLDADWLKLGEWNARELSNFDFASQIDGRTKGFPHLSGQRPTHLFRTKFELGFMVSKNRKWYFSWVLHTA